MERKTRGATDESTRAREARQDGSAGQPERVPTHENTHPRGNPEPDRRDLERSRERFESLLGR
jgi:hypothetical protein